MVKTIDQWTYNSKESKQDYIYSRAVNPTFRTATATPHVVWEVQLFIKLPGANIFQQIGSYQAAYKLSTFLALYGSGEDSLIKMFTEVDQRLIEQIEYVTDLSVWPSSSIQPETRYFGWKSIDLEIYQVPEGSEFRSLNF